MQKQIFHISALNNFGVHLPNQMKYGNQNPVHPIFQQPQAYNPAKYGGYRGVQPVQVQQWPHQNSNSVVRHGRDF